MKTILGVVLSLFALNAFSAQISCYQGGRNITYEYGSNVAYSDNGVLSFMDKDKKIVFIAISTADCIIRMDQNEAMK
jgi:hypothetical protein